MFGDVSIIRSAAKNPATSPELTEALKQSVTAKRAQVLSVLQQALAKFPAITFANSFGAEDMVLTDIIMREKLAIEIFSRHRALASRNLHFDVRSREHLSNQT